MDVHVRQVIILVTDILGPLIRYYTVVDSEAI